MFHTAKSSPVVSGLCQQCRMGSSCSIPWAVECIFWSAWPLPLNTHGLTGCWVTVREPATSAAHFRFQAHTRCERRLIQSLLWQLLQQNKRMGCWNAFSGYWPAMLGMGPVYRHCSLPVALPGSLWDCSAGFLQRGAEDIVGVRDAGQRFHENWQASQLAGCFSLLWKSWQVKSSPQIWETVCWNILLLVCHFSSPGPNKIPVVMEGGVSDSLVNLCVFFRVWCSSNKTA